MRAGPLSDAKVISLLNAHFVPVYISNEDYGERGGASKDEKKAWRKIYLEALEEKRDAGSVCIYLVSPDGDGFDSLIVSEACQDDRLARMLEAAVARYQAAAGKPIIEPRPQSRAPETEVGAVALHLVSRIDHRYSWGEFPAENWIVLSAEDQQKFAPAFGRQGEKWEIDPAVAAKVLTHFYPQTETCYHSRDTDPNGPHGHRLEEHSLTAEVIKASGTTVRLRLSGTLRLKHTFYPNKKDDNRATANVVGYADVDAAAKRLTSLRLSTESAKYGKHGFSVAVQSVKSGK